jgi:hypothetical protein
MSNKFVSLEMIAELTQTAQGGCEWSRVQLEELGVWEPSPAVPSSNERPCNCGSGEAWVSCSANSAYCG